MKLSLNHKQLVRLTMVFLLMGTAVLMSHGKIQADTSIAIRNSLEWLVDESDVIAIVRFQEANGYDNPAVIRGLKGEAGAIEWPLTPPTYERDQKMHLLPGEGSSKIRLLYVRGHSELLDSVCLARDRIEDNPRLSSVLYGVSQYGDLILSESELYRCIENRLRTTYTKIERRPQFLYGRVPFNSPLESEDELCSLRVPSDTGRRDYFLNLLTIGDAAEKIFAVEELARFRDSYALNAVESATKCAEATIVYYRRIDSREIAEWNAETVRYSASSLLKLIKENQ